MSADQLLRQEAERKEQMRNNAARAVLDTLEGVVGPYGPTHYRPNGTHNAWRVSLDFSSITQATDFIQALIAARVVSK